MALTSAACNVVRIVSVRGRHVYATLTQLELYMPTLDVMLQMRMSVAQLQRRTTSGRHDCPDPWCWTSL